MLKKICGTYSIWGEIDKKNPRSLKKYTDEKLIKENICGAYSIWGDGIIQLQMEIVIYLTKFTSLKREELVHEKSIYPGAKRTGDWELTYESNDLMEVMKAFDRMH